MTCGGGGGGGRGRGGGGGAGAGAGQSADVDLRTNSVRPGAVCEETAGRGGGTASVFRELRIASPDLITLESWMKQPRFPSWCKRTCPSQACVCTCTSLPTNQQQRQQQQHHHHHHAHMHCTSTDHARRECMLRASLPQDRARGSDGPPPAERGKCLARSDG